jgi:hypothetical protein
LCQEKDGDDNIEGNGNSDKGGGVMATKRAIATATRVADNKEGDGKGGKGDGKGGKVSDNSNKVTGDDEGNGKGSKGKSKGNEVGGQQRGQCQGQ